MNSASLSCPFSKLQREQQARPSRVIALPHAPPSRRRAAGHGSRAGGRSSALNAPLSSHRPFIALSFFFGYSSPAWVCPAPPDGDETAPRAGCRPHVLQCHRQQGTAMTAKPRPDWGGKRLPWTTTNAIWSARSQLRRRPGGRGGSLLAVSKRRHPLSPAATVRAERVGGGSEGQTSDNHHDTRSARPWGAGRGRRRVGLAAPVDAHEGGVLPLPLPRLPASPALPEGAGGPHRQMFPLRPQPHLPAGVSGYRLGSRPHQRRAGRRTRNQGGGLEPAPLLCETTAREPCCSASGV
jgi:hypothetical protein